MNIEQMLDTLIGKEGGYSNHPSDTGGETMWGITLAVARANGYTGAMKAMPRETAKAIYRNKYYVLPGYAAVALQSPAIAEELFDTGVNMGPGTGSTFLQRLLNALNRQGRDYGDLKVDADLGPASLTALKAYLGKRGKEGEKVILNGLNALQGARYVALAEGRGANEDFLHGWLAHRVTL
jgi:lysozyme family protein